MRQQERHVAAGHNRAPMAFRGADTISDPRLTSPGLIYTKRHAERWPMLATTAIGRGHGAMIDKAGLSFVLPQHLLFVLGQ